MKNKKQIIWFALMIIIMIVIFCFSSQTGDTSAQIGDSVAKAMNITSNSESIGESKMKLLFGLNLRKWAHIGLFGALGLCSTMCVCSWKKAIIICLGYAVFDEIHQFFVAGREASFLDIVIDVVGFVSIIIVVEVIRQAHTRLVRNRSIEV